MFSLGSPDSEAASSIVLAGEPGLGGVVERDVAELLDENVNTLDLVVLAVSLDCNGASGPFDCVVGAITSFLAFEFDRLKKLRTRPNFGFWSFVGEGGDAACVVLFLLSGVSLLQLALRCVGGSFAGDVNSPMDLGGSVLIAAVVIEARLEVLFGLAFTGTGRLSGGEPSFGVAGGTSVLVTSLDVATVLIGLPEPFCC